ncbi:MAG: cation:proton antiporter domain-containing protein [Planctomycetota bacterium]
MGSIEHLLLLSNNLNIILLIGLAIFFGTIAAKILQKIHIPQIIGYITIGIILGPFLKIISPATIETMESFNLFALGVIGFLIGGELKRDIFVKFGKQVIAILLFEGLAAFFLVGVSSFLAMQFFVDWQTALAVGVVFGAICAATDPASTVNVLWEYKTRGPLTSMLTAIVALDDLLALLLYITSISIAGMLKGHQQESAAAIIFHSLYEILGSFGLGVAAALLLKWILKRIDDNEKTLVFSLGAIALTIGVSASLGLDVILSTMVLGIILINVLPRRSLRSFELVREFSPPVYVLFFVVIGARFVFHLGTIIWLLAAIYVIGSIIGKTVGSKIGAVYSKAVPTVRKYLGYCLYQQGTIAIALMIMASTRFEGPIRETMVSVIIIGVFVLQFIGPLCVKIGIKKAGEVGMNITEEDLIKTYQISDVMDTKVPLISAGMCLGEVIQVVSQTNNFYYPVVDNEKKLIGAVTLDGIRNTFTTQELNDWLVALDIMEPIIVKQVPEVALSEAFYRAEKLDIEHVPIVSSDKDDTFVGILDCRTVHRALTAEVLERQRKADSMQKIST